jgi:hypothetical protein
MCAMALELKTVTAGNDALKEHQQRRLREAAMMRYAGIYQCRFTEIVCCDMVMMRLCMQVTRAGRWAA